MVIKLHYACLERNNEYVQKYMSFLTNIPLINEMGKNGRCRYFYKMIKVLFIFFSLLKMSYTVKKEIAFEVIFLHVMTYFLKTDCLVIAKFKSLKQNQNFQK